MSESNQPKLSLDRNVGDIKVKFQDASLHIFLTEEERFLVIEQNDIHDLISKLEGALGPINTKRSDSKIEIKGPGQYTVDSTLYLSKNYKVNIIQDEFYVGAAGGTSQILLEIATGIASGIGAELSRRMLNLILKSSKNSENKISKSSIYKKVKNLLYNYYGASGEITFTETIEEENQIHMTATDMRVKIYKITVNIDSGVPSIIIKN